MKPRVRILLSALFCAAAAHAQPASTPPEQKSPASTDAKIPVEKAPADAIPEEEIVVLTPFEVSSAKDTGYQATETLGGTRIRTKLKDVGTSLTVVTKDFLQDVGATNTATLLQYTTNTEVSGTLGTYAGLGNGWTPNETSTLRSNGYVNRVRGLAAAELTRDFFSTDIPWDSYNTERIDLQRGANSIMFGLGSPGGIINATVNNALFTTKGQVEAQFGSYGSTRGSLDYNQVLIDNTLALRVDGLADYKKFQEKPAHEDDRRVSLALRYDPKLIKAKGFNTSIKAKYEAGKIDANRPRILPPYDQITPWFKPVQQVNPNDPNSLYTANSGLGKVGVNYPTEVVSTSNPWIGQTAANQQQPIWFINGDNGQLYQIYGGFVNRGAISNKGVAQGSSSSLTNQKYGDEFPGIRSFSSYANQAQLPGWQNGQYRDKVITDSSIFNFYDNLIDGDTKKEFGKWEAYNFDVTQTGWDDRVGVQLSYDHQWYKDGGQSLIGTPAISVDILRNLQDRPDVTAGSPATNPNYGRPFIVAGPGTGSYHRSIRESYRASLFGELRSTDFFTKDSLLAKILGYHRFNGVYSGEKLDTEDRSWNLYANSQAWAGYWNQNAGNTSAITDRPPVSVIYLGSGNSIASSTNGSNLNIPRINSDVTLSSGNVYHFNSTWNAPASVNYATPWTVPASLTNLINNATPTTEASNPANYVGWNSNFTDTLITDKNTLLTSASKAQRKVDSLSGSWQGFMWNEAIVPTLGWRYDEVKSLSIAAKPVSSNRNILNTDPSVYTLPSTYRADQIYKAHSTAGGLVVHLNNFLKKDPLPFDISLSYNKSNNFQVTNARTDFYGNAIANPTGTTKEYGVQLSTKDGKYSLRLQKYETVGKNVAMDTNLDGLANTITQGLKFRNVLLYRLKAYDLSGNEQPTNGHGNRYNWYQGYVDNTTGKVIADYDETNPSSTPQPANSTLETPAQAAARRDASIRAWNAIQQKMSDLGFFAAWQYTPTTQSALTDRATLEATGTLDANGKLIYAQQYTPVSSTVVSYARIAPAGMTLTSDTESKGYELEFIANPTQSLRISLNASKTSAVRSNVGSALLDQTVAYMDQQMSGAAGDMRQYNGAYVRGNELRFTYAQWRGQYALAKLQDGAEAPELRKLHVNIIANYTFHQGLIKGAFLGGGYRWADKVVIGYPMIPVAGSDYGTYDLSKPFYGPSESAVDLWIGYERKLSRKLDWKIQLNVRNVGQKEGLIPITVEPDGVTPAAYRIKPVQEWTVTNTFSF